jgi:hypothetical protein
MLRFGLYSVTHLVLYYKVLNLRLFQAIIAVKTPGK